MIRLQDLTPDVYYRQSRDFQFIGRLYDVILNSVRTNSANLYNLPIGKNMDERLLNLLALTLGFQSKHRYNSKHLAAICSVLPLILRQKGSIMAIITAVNALLSSEGIAESLDYVVNSKKYITLYLPDQLSDVNLLQDLLTYILPAGIGCQMVKEINKKVSAETNLTTSDSVRAYYDVEEQVYNQMLRLDERRPDSDIENASSGNIGGNSGILQNVSVSDKALKGDERLPKLNAPTIAIAGDTLTVNEVDNAQTYNIYVDGEKKGTI